VKNKKINTTTDKHINWGE